ncbi:MAG: LptF/LptG family permease [Prevotellaceae bacterium]|jgi:lipopolysaccharide export system permease protein|nr:LptF/LptG family permease [Prevotellaceae bacterium]
MKRLDRYILSSYLSPMMLTFFVMTFVVMLQLLWLYIDDLVGKGLGLTVIAEFLFWGIVTYVPLLVLPLSTLLSSLMTMGTLGENNELLAMKAAGMSIQRVMRPLMGLVLLVTIAAFFVANSLAPYAHLQIRTLMYDIRQKRMEIKIPAGIFYNGIDDYSLRIERQDERTQRMYDMIIYDHTDKRGNVSVTRADSGYMKLTSNKTHVIVKLFSGYAYEESQQQSGDSVFPFQKRYFSEQEVLIPLQNYEFKRSEDNDRFKNQAEIKSLRELGMISDSLALTQHNLTNTYTSDFRYKASLARTHELDTTKTFRERYIYTINSDSLFALLPTQRKITAVNSAINRVTQALSQNEVYITNYEQADYPKRRANVEWHRKFTLSIACLIFFFIGAPLGAIIRKGGLGMPAVVSSFFFVIYWVVDISGKKLAQDGVWEPAMGIWLSSFVLLPMGIFLTYKATTDSALFNTDRYIDGLKKIIKIFNKKRRQS